MKKASFSLIIPFALLALMAMGSSCGKNRPSPETASDQELAEVGKNTKPFDAGSINPASSGESFIALKLFILDGKIVADSTRASLVQGKYNRGTDIGNFRVEFQDVNGKNLGTFLGESFLKVRSCDEGGQTHIDVVKRGWTEIYMPAIADISKFLVFENREMAQQIDLTPALKKMRAELERGKEK